MLKNLIPFIILCVLLSCGRKIEDKNTEINRQVTPIVIEPTTERVLRELKAQRLSCGSFEGESCPSFIAKVSILSKVTSRTCQGTLIGSNKVLLSGSCLPISLRTNGVSCRKSIVVSFPTFGDELDNHECEMVESVSSNLRRTTELWDNDFAVIRLRTKTVRKPVSLSSFGIGDSQKLERWAFKIESSNEATIFKDSCIRIKNSYANPFANKLNASFQVFSDCEKKINVLGASMFDSKGELVGVQSKRLGKRIVKSLDRAGLLSEKTLPLIYVSNLGCSDFRVDNDYPRPIDCFELKSVYMLDRKRSDLILGKGIHGENIKLVEEQLSTSTKYFKWNFKFFKSKKKAGYVVKMTRPDCFFGVDEWIREYRKGKKIRTPGYKRVRKEDYTLKTKLNKFLQPTSVVENLGFKEYQVKFNPFTAYVDRTTYLATKSDPNSRNYDVIFENIKECI